MRNAMSRHPQGEATAIGNIRLLDLRSDMTWDNISYGSAAGQQGGQHTLVLPEHGQITIRLGGRTHDVADGQYLLLESRHVMFISAGAGSRATVVMMPTPQLQARLRIIPLMAKALPTSELHWRVARSFLKTLSDEDRHIPPQLAYSYSTQMIELVSVALESDLFGHSGDAARHPILNRCIAYVRNNISNRDLSPLAISEAMGISVRYLHRIFQGSGMSVCDFLRTARLEAAKRDLGDPNKGFMQIREVALRVGFRSQAHFAAAFKSEYGMSATEWRQASKCSQVLGPTLPVGLL